MKQEALITEETGWEFWISQSHLNRNWNLIAGTSIRSFVTFVGNEFKVSFVLRIKYDVLRNRPQTQTCKLRFGLDYKESASFTHRSLWPVALANNWQHGKAIAPRLPPSPPLLPKLELFFLRNPAGIYGSRKCMLTYLLWLRQCARERKRHSEQTPDTRGGCLRVKMGGDPHWQMETISHTQASSTE